MKKSILSLITLLILATILVGCSSGAEQTKEKVDEKNQNTEVASETSKISDTETTDNTEAKQTSRNEDIKFYFTANEGGSISKISVSNDKVVDTIEVDGVVHNVQVSPDQMILGATVIPGNGDSHGDDSHGEDSHDGGMKGKALFYDTYSNELLQNVEVGSHPAHIVFTEDGKFALVTNSEDNNVSVIDMKNFSVIETIETGKGPHGFRISDDSQMAYIANTGEDTVSVLNLISMTEEKRIIVGSTPITTDISSDGNTLVTTLNAENMLAIIDLTSGKVEKVEVGIGPAQVYIDDKDKTAYVANQGTANEPSNTISVIDLLNKKVTATIETGKGAHGVVLSSDNKRLYITNMFENTVTVIDAELNKVIDTIEVGEVPNGISIMN